MPRFSIADISIHIEGVQFDYFHQRMAQYRSDALSTHPEVCITYQQDNKIVVPKGKVLANVNQRYWLRTAEDGYANYDYFTQVTDILAMVVANRTWTSIQLRLHDLKGILDRPEDMRCFNHVGEIFRYVILHFEGMILHASAIDFDGHGIAFSAPSGTGKSTHVSNWKRYYNEKTTIINDDTPAIRLRDGAPYLYGTPWSGKTDINCNQSVPLKAIVFLEQGKQNQIRRIDGHEAIARFMNEIRMPVFEEMVDLLMRIIHQVLTKVPVYVLACDISKEAVDLVKETLEL